jgi:hypothetical protein
MQTKAGRNIPARFFYFFMLGDVLKTAQLFGIINVGTLAKVSIQRIWKER